MNSSKLKIKMLETNISIKDVADALNISMQALYKKINGETNITIEDVRKIKNILNLNDEEVKEIFLI